VAVAGIFVLMRLQEGPLSRTRLADIRVRDHRTSLSPPDSPKDVLPTGHVIHDARGNAVWEWLADVDEPTRLPGQLRLADTGEFTSSPRGTVKLRPTVAASGYNPYESGLIQPNARPVKRDLRALSRWIELRRTRSTQQ